jgi:hypothetical protein
VIQGCVQEQAALGTTSGRNIPSTTFDADIVANGAQLIQLTIGHDDTVLADNGDLATIGTPHDLLHFRRGNFSQDASRLNFKQDGPIFGPEDDATRSTSVKNGIDIWNGGLNTLGSLIAHVLDGDLSLMPIEDGESIASQKDSGSQAGSSLSISDTATGIGETKGDEFIGTSIDITSDQDIAFTWIVVIVGQVSWSTADTIRLCLLSYTPEGRNGDIHPCSSRGTGATGIMAE